ncbi:hypothetical protein [Exiguobacterium acetylicum]|uniref:hypothetical protein n=1 Tax=Exiguobacterium acetylicum TaxID=41170 RepID=UPI001EE18E8B|nr:hypothetical protein [Exiguobacterium acetylicum]UKS54700.1 hypothetical protein K6T22_09030 [Exiguobacterium acetylicum]
MKRVNVLLDILLIGVGMYLTMTDPAAKTLGTIMILAGVTSRITGTVFSPTDPYDERQGTIKIRSGHIAYLVSIGYLFLILVLVNLSIIQDIQLALLLAIGGQVLFFPVALLYVNRKM